MKDGIYDIIQIRLTRKDYKLVSLVRAKIGENSKTKIVVCLDFSEKRWRKEFIWLSNLKKTVKSADMVYGVEYTIAQKLEKLTGKKIYEIAHPADIEKLKSFQFPKKKGALTVLYNSSFLKYDE